MVGMRAGTGQILTDEFSDGNIRAGFSSFSYVNTAFAVPQ